MILDCIRHGVTASNLAGRFNDSEDESLDVGQIATIKADVLRTNAYDRIYVSSYRRCVETARLLGLSGWIAEPRITERGLGVFQGLTAEQCRALHAEDFEAFSRFEAEPAIPGGESRAQHFARVMDWLEEAARGDPGRALAITHGGVVDFLYRLGCGRPIHGGERIFGGDNLAVSSFEVSWPNVRLLAFSQPLPAAALRVH